MNKIQKVDALEVKRCFVISQLVRKLELKKTSSGLATLKSGRRLLRQISYGEFKRRLKIAENKVLKLSEEKLDKEIYAEWRKRFRAYNNCNWYLMEVSPKDVGVWRKAAGLPQDWTECSLIETSRRVKEDILDSRKLVNKKVKNAVTNILKTNIKQLQKEKYLLPIMFQSGTGTKGRKKLKYQTKYDIDDGCMRSIALTISGAKKIKAYIGFPKKLF